MSKILPDYCIPGTPIKKVQGVIVHYVSVKNVAPKTPFDMYRCRELFLDLNREKSSREKYMKDDKWPDKRMHASAHILIGRSGEVWRLVEFDKQAYHAGPSVLQGRPACNRWTIGIELVGDTHSGFTREQYFALANTLQDLQKQFKFARRFVAGHDSVRYAAIQARPKNGYRYKYDPSGRKDGQGNNFDWFYLGKLWNDIEHDPEGVMGLEDMDAILATTTKSF